MWGTIGIDGQTHQQAVGLPLGDEARNDGKPVGGRYRGNNGERPCASGEAIADRYPNTGSAKIKGKPGDWACRGHLRRDQPPRRD